MEGPANITNQDILEIKISLAKMLVNQEVFLAQFKDHIVDDKLMQTRLTALETKYTYATGFIAALVVIWGLISNLIMSKIGLR
jgi:hypothetical protein